MKRRLKRRNAWLWRFKPRNASGFGVFDIYGGHRRRRGEPGVFTVRVLHYRGSSERVLVQKFLPVLLLGAGRSNERTVYGY